MSSSMSEFTVFQLDDVEHVEIYLEILNMFLSISNIEASSLTIIESMVDSSIAQLKSTPPIEVTNLFICLF